MGVLQLLAGDNFITYNKVVARAYGVQSAILLGALCSYQNSFKNQEFYKEQWKISEDTCLSVYEIQQALKVLKSNGIVEIKKRGLPAVNYYRVVEVKLSKILTTCDEEFRSLEVEKLDHNINNTINNNTNNNNSIKERKKDNNNYDEIIEANVISPDIKEALYDFIKMRTMIKKPMTDRALELLINRLKKMSGGSVELSVAMLHQSIRNNWQDVYEVKQETKNVIVSARQEIEDPKPQVVSKEKSILDMTDEELAQYYGGC